jgi:hypothetical protein
MKRAVFKNNNQILGSCDADVTIKGIEAIKKAIAIEEGIGVDDIEVTFEELPEETCSGLVVSPNGKLLADDDEILGIKCIMNIENNIDRFLDRINDGSIINTLVFTFKA